MDAEESWHDSIYSIYNETAHGITKLKLVVCNWSGHD